MVGKINTFRMNILFSFVANLIQVRTQDFARGRGSEAETCQCSEAGSCEQSELCVTGVPGPFKDPGSFWVQYQKLIKVVHYIALQSI